MRSRIALAALIAVVPVLISAGAIIKSDKEGEGIEFWTKETGQSYSKKAEITDAGTLKVETIQNAAGSVPPGMVPLGGLVPVMASITGAWQPPAIGDIRDGFMLADGAAFHADCTLTGNTPNMAGNYLRGSTTNSWPTVAASGSNTQTTNVTVGNHSTLALNNESTHTHTGGSLFAHIALYSGSNSVFSQRDASHDSYDSDRCGTLTINATGCPTGVTSNATVVSGTTSAGSVHTHTFSTNISAHSVTNNAVNNEPANLTTVWVIRCK